MYDISINQDASLGTAEDVDGLTLLHSGENFCSLNREATSHCASENQTRGIKRVTDEAIPEHLKTLYDNACNDWTDVEKKMIAETLIKFQNTFSRHDFYLGLTHLVKHSIDVGNHPPIKQSLRSVPVAFAAEEETVMKQLEAQGVIRKSNSAWASPICLVRKRSRKIRPCVAYPRLNEITRKDAFPLPRVSDCLDAMAGAKFLSSFDLTSGFHQVPIKTEDIPKTAFCTKYGLNEYLTMPMGMTNSPAVFQRLMQLALGSL